EETGDLIIFSQVVLSLQLGFAIIPLIHFVSDKKKMGTFAIGTWTKIAAWISAAIIVGLNGKLVLTEISSLLDIAGRNQWIVYATVIPIVVGASLLLLYILVQPFVTARKYRLSGPHKVLLPLDFELNKHFDRI